MPSGSSGSIIRRIVSSHAHFCRHFDWIDLAAAASRTCCILPVLASACFLLKRLTDSVSPVFVCAQPKHHTS